MTAAVDRARGRHAPSDSEGLAKWWGVLFMLPLPNRTEGEKQGPGAVGGSAPVRQADIDGVQVRDDRRLVMVALDREDGDVAVRLRRSKATTPRGRPRAGPHRAGPARARPRAARRTVRPRGGSACTTWHMSLRVSSSPGRRGQRAASPSLSRHRAGLEFVNGSASRLRSAAFILARRVSIGQFSAARPARTREHGRRSGGQVAIVALSTVRLRNPEDLERPIRRKVNTESGEVEQQIRDVEHRIRRS